MKKKVTNLVNVNTNFRTSVKFKFNKKIFEDIIDEMKNSFEDGTQSYESYNAFKAKVEQEPTTSIGFTEAYFIKFLEVLKRKFKEYLTKKISKGEEKLININIDEIEKSIKDYHTRTKTK